MATKDTGQPANGISRRAFVTSAAVAATAVGCGFDVAYDADKALAYENDAVNYKVTTTTCPYCSASCGQRVVTALTGASAGSVVDIYGDFESPMNAGGLCAKGAGSIQLVNNTRRIGAWTTAHPVNPVFTANTTTYPNGVAYKRTGNGAWARWIFRPHMARSRPTWSPLVERSPTPMATTARVSRSSAHRT